MPLNLITARPFGLFRDYIFRIFRATERGQGTKAIADITAFILFQAPLYAVILYRAGAKPGQIITACSTACFVSLFLGRPYGIFLDFCRRVLRAVEIS